MLLTRTKVQAPKRIVISRSSLLSLSIWLWILCSILFGRTNIQSLCGIDSLTIYNVGRILVYGMLFAIVWLQTWTRKKFLLFTSVLIITLISMIVSGKRVLLSIVLFYMVAQAEQEDQKLTMSFLKANLFVFLLTVLLAQIGIIDTGIAYRGDIARNSLGFSHPNGLAGVFSVILILYYYINWEKLKWYHYTISALILMQIWQISNSRTQLIIIALLILAAAFLHLVHTSKKYCLMYILSYTVLFFCVGISLWAMFFFETESVFGRVIDPLFSFRFSLINSAYNEFGITLWGNRAVNAMLDNSYAWILLSTGIAPALIYLIFWIYSIRKAYKQREEKLQLAICLFLLMGLLENSMFRIESNFIPLIIAGYSWKAKECKDYDPPNLYFVRTQYEQQCIAPSII